MSDPRQLDAFLALLEALYHTSHASINLCYTENQHRPGIASNDNTMHVPTKPNHTNTTQPNDSQVTTKNKKKGSDITTDPGGHRPHLLVITT